MTTTTLMTALTEEPISDVGLGRVHGWPGRRRSSETEEGGSSCCYHDMPAVVQATAAGSQESAVAGLLMVAGEEEEEAGGGGLTCTTPPERQQHGPALAPTSTAPSSEQSPARLPTSSYPAGATASGSGDFVVRSSSSSLSSSRSFDERRLLGPAPSLQHYLSTDQVRRPDTRPAAAAGPACPGGSSWWCFADREGGGAGRQACPPSLSL